MTRKCNKCNEEKDVLFFNKSKSYKCGYRSHCKACARENQLVASRTKKGLIAELYKAQKGNAKIRGRELPTYTRKEFSEWLMSQESFHLIYDNWKRLDYQKRYRPSVDRTNPNISYTIDNIKLMTWGENQDKAYTDMRNGIQTVQMNPQMAVIQLTKNSDFVAKYVSQNEAARQTGVHQVSIGKCISGERKHAGGYKWQNAKEV